ncbi:MAG: CapA family protein, partial [Nitrospinaceae bacterium]|nr:CapA family protein [Nitrospinaceae bacterium]NIY17526.1 CapA family protein [Nitrospinaceae bacterium]
SRNCYAFRTPPSMAPRLAEAGFNALNVANNHAYDFGARGISETLSLLDTIGIQPVGGKRVATFEIRGVHVAVAGFSYFDTPYSYSILQLPAAAKVVADLKKEHDIVVVTFHGGAEGKSARHIQNEPEVYLGEKRGNVIAFAHSVIDAGADLVIGHGPHVLRAMEEYKGKLIAYSMGNFLTYERFNISGPSGLSAVLTVRIDPETGNFLNGEIHPVRLKGPGLPFIDPDG